MVPCRHKAEPRKFYRRGEKRGGKEGSCTAGISSHAEVEMLHHPIPKRSCVFSAGMAGRGTGEPCLLQGKARGEASPHTPPIHTVLPWRCPPSLAPSGEENQSSGLRTRPYRPNPPAGTERLKRVAKKRRTASNAATTARSTASILSAGTARPAATTAPGERGEAEGEGGGSTWYVPLRPAPRGVEAPQAEGRPAVARLWVVIVALIQPNRAVGWKGPQGS